MRSACTVFCHVAVSVILVLHGLVCPVVEMERPLVVVAGRHGVGDMHQLVAVVLQAEAVGRRRGARLVDGQRALAVNPDGVAHHVVLRLLVVLRVVGRQVPPLAVVGRREAVLTVVEQAVSPLARLAPGVPAIGGHRAVLAVLVLK